MRGPEKHLLWPPAAPNGFGNGGRTQSNTIGLRLAGSGFRDLAPEAKRASLCGMFKRTRIATALVVCVAPFFFSGCASYVQRGSTLYDEGHYVDAAEVFERTEQRLSGAGNRDCAQYGLYRGLTLLALGDLRSSHRWLSYAYNVERAVPGSLEPRERAMLDQGWGALNQRLIGETQSPPAPPGSAVAAQPGTVAPNAQAGQTPRPQARSFAQ